MGRLGISIVRGAGRRSLSVCAPPGLPVPVGAAEWETETVKLRKLLDRLQELDFKGYSVFNGLYTFAVGMDFSQVQYWD